MSTMVLPAVHLPARTSARSAAGDDGRLRLTRRGRLVVFVVGLLVAVAIAVAFAGGSVATSEKGQPVPTDTIVVGTGVTLWDIASARAEGGEYVFDVTVVRVGGQVYRFLTAVQASSAGTAAGIAGKVANSFRLLSTAEKESLKPLRIRIVTASAGDSTASLAARMVGVEGKTAMFRLLNDLDANENVKPGTRYKIVAE